MPRPPRLHDDDAALIAGFARRLADQLTGPASNHLRAAISAALDSGYPATTAGSGNPSSSGNDSSIPERLAAHTDRGVEAANRTITRLHRIANELGRVCHDLEQWAADRPTQTCPECGHPLEQGRSRCQRTNPDTGRQCGASPTQRTCCNPHCGKVMATGEPLTDGRCDTCYRYRRRNDGRDRIPANALAIDTDRVIVQPDPDPANGAP